MEFPFPPLPEQEHFARVVRRALCRVYRDIEALRGRQGESARQGGEVVSEPIGTIIWRQLMEEKLKALLEFIKTEGRICPNPQEWNVLWEMLPDKKRVGSGWEPPLPLILAAWWDTPLLAKILRFDEHIRYAAEHGALDEVDTYLRGLKSEQWFYGR